MKVRGVWAMRIRRWTEWTVYFVIGGFGCLVVAAAIVGTLFLMGRLPLP